jgi:hypothetical protein
MLSFSDGTRLEKKFYGCMDCAILEIKRFYNTLFFLLFFFLFFFHFFLENMTAEIVGMHFLSFAKHTKSQTALSVEVKITYIGLFVC